MINWCNQDVGASCGWGDMVFYKQCAMNAPTEAHQMQLEAQFWIVVYRSLQENRFEGFINADELLQKILTGQRCYFLQWHRADYPEGLLSKVKCRMDDYLEKLKATPWGSFEKHLRAQTKLEYGLDGKSYKKFNPFNRALGVWCVVKGLNNLSEASHAAGGEIKLYEEISDIRDESYLSRILTGTKECILRRRICPVPAKPN